MRDYLDQGTTEKAPEKLWLPGQPLDHAYPMPESEELAAYWSDIHDHANVVASPGVYGAIRLPDETPTIVVSVDLCEVVRGTVHSMLGVFAKKPEDIINHNNYGTNFDIESNVVIPIVQTLINYDHVQPVDGIEEIADTIRNWKSLGVYVVANTATLPGCEVATISFLNRYLKNCFDGILLARNHDANGQINKGHALRFLLEEHADTSNTFAIHIDDAPHHCEAVTREVGNLIGSHNVETIMPLYPNTSARPTGTEIADSPREAFAIANNFVRQRR